MFLVWLSGLYVPIQFREACPSNATRLKQLFVTSTASENLEQLVQKGIALETGLFASRDIGGADPERMSPPNVALYCEKLFSSGLIKMEIIRDQDRIEKEFPLFGAVNRAARVVTRHEGRIIFLEYVPRKTSRKTLMLVGKGVTYDTGELIETQT